MGRYPTNFCRPRSIKASRSHYPQRRAIDFGFLNTIMIAGFSAFCVVFGAAIAYVAKSYPRHREAMETMGGILLIGGLGLLGFAL